MKPFKHLRSAAAIFILTTTAGTPVLAQKVSMTGRASKESVFTQALPPALQMHKSRL